jgi:MFS transporter, OFA family, oxalate/formate antiporter
VTADAFGAHHLGINFGIMFLTIAVAAYLGPRLGTMMAEAHGGDFSSAFVVAAIINLAALSLIGLHLLIRRRRRLAAAVEPGS